MAQRRCLDFPASGLDLGDLLPDRDHGVAESIQLRLRFGFGRLDHQRARHRKTHGRGVEAVVDQPLGDIVHGDAGFCLQRAGIDDAFMRDPPLHVAVQHRKMRIEPLRDIVGVEDRDLGGARQAFAAHHQDVDVGDGQDRGRAERRRRDRADRGGCCAVGRGMAGQERYEVRFHADRAHAGSAAAVRNAEGLVQVEVADVGAVVAGPRQADLRIHVGAVEIDLTAMAMHDVADFADVLLEHAVRRGIGDHDRREPIGVLRRLGLEIVDVDVAARIAGHHHDLHAGHVGGGRIGAVRGGGDQADRAVAARRAWHDSRGSPEGRHIRPARRSSAAARSHRSR